MALRGDVHHVAAGDDGEVLAVDEVLEAAER